MNKEDQQDIAISFDFNYFRGPLNNRGPKRLVFLPQGGKNFLEL